MFYWFTGHSAERICASDSMFYPLRVTNCFMIMIMITSMQENDVQATQTQWCRSFTAGGQESP